MSSNAICYEQVETEALQLPQSERSMLANKLFASLDGEKDSEAELKAEIRRRSQQIDEGSVELVSHDSVLSRVRSKVREVRKSQPAP